MFTRLSACVSLALSATYSSAWLPAAPITAAPRRELFARRSTSLFLTPRDIARMNGGSNNEEEEEAAAAARAARETLERMWTSPPLQEEGEDSGVVGLPELEGEMADGDGAQDLEVRRGNPFPTSSERGALEAAAAAQKALLAGKRGLVLDIEVRQLDDEHQEFDADLLIHFVTEVAKSLAGVSGRAKVMLRGDQLATRATETLMKANMDAVELGIDPRDDLSFCSFRTGNLDDEGDPDSMEDFASMAARGIGPEDRLVVLACPRSNADIIVMREVMQAAKGRPVVLLNPRMVHMPRETADYDTIYLLRQFNVQPIKIDPRKAAKKSPLRISPQQRKQQNIFSELGQVIPKVLITRAFPDDFKLYLDIDGKGFQLNYTYDRNPHPTTICLRAQKLIEEAQRDVTRQMQIDAAKKRAQEMKDRWDEDDEDEDDDDDPRPRRLTNEEIDARLRE